jgi:hypothetical protein
MTAETATNEARDVALGEVESLEGLEQKVLDGVLVGYDPSETLHEWLNSDVLDIRATYSLNPKSLVGVEVMTAFGGPTVWVSYNGNQGGTLMVKAYWGGDRWETHATAPSVADYLWEIVEAYE